MPRDDFKPLADGATECFGRDRTQVSVYAAGQDKVEVYIDGTWTASRPSLLLDPLDCADLAHWLTAVLAPSIPNVNRGEPDDAE